MQKSLSDSFRRIKKDSFNAKNKNKSSNEDILSQSSSKNTIRYVNVGVQTDDFNVSPPMHAKMIINGELPCESPSLCSDQSSPLSNESFFSDSNDSTKQKIGIILPPNYSIVYLNSPNDFSTDRKSESSLSSALNQYLTIKNDKTQHQLNVLISHDGNRKSPAKFDDNLSIGSCSTRCMSQRDDISMASVKSFTKMGNTEETHEPLSSTHRFRRSTETLNADAVLRQRMNSVARRQTFHHSEKPSVDRLLMLKDLLKSNSRSSSSLSADVNAKQLDQDNPSTGENYANTDITQVFENVLFAVKHSYKKTGISTDNLFNHLQKVFKVPSEQQIKLLKTLKSRDAPIFELIIVQIEAHQLRPQYLKASVDAYVVLYLTSNPTNTISTSVKFDTLNPTWEENITFTFSGIDDENLVVEFWEDTLKGANTLKVMKNAVKTTMGSKQNNRLIGSATIPLKQSSDDSTWYELFKRDSPKKRGEVKVKYSKCAQHQHDIGFDEHKDLLNALTLYELNEWKVGLYLWMGNFSKNSIEVLKIHADNCGLSTVDIVFCRWTVFIDIHLQHRFAFELFDKELTILKPAILNAIVKEETREQFWLSAVKLLPSAFCMISERRKIRSDHKTEVQNLTEVLNFVSNITALTPPEGIDLFPERLYSWMNHKSMEEPLTLTILLETATELGAKAWLDEMNAEGRNIYDTEENQLQYFVTIVQLVQSDLETAIKYFDAVFKRTLNFDYSRTLFITYDSALFEMIGSIVPKVCNNLKTNSYDDSGRSESDEDLMIKTTLFDLFINLSQLLEIGRKISPSDGPKFKLRSFHQWFNIGVMHWLHISNCKAKMRIIKAIDLDKLLPVGDTINYSSSAVDTLDIFFQMKALWEQLNWPEVDEAFSFVARIINDICNCCDLYSDKMTEKANLITQSPEVTREWCIAANNIHHITESLSTLVSDMGFNSIISQISKLHGSERCADTLKAVISNTKDTQINKIEKLTTNMVERMVSTIKELLDDLSRQSQPDSDSMDGLMSFLEDSLQLLNAELNSTVFNSMFCELWRNVIVKLGNLVKEGINDTKPPFYFSNILDAVNLMLENFKSKNNEPDPDLAETLELLQKHRVTTAQLILAYYEHRISEQNKMGASQYGILAVKCSINENNLTIEILNAKNLLPMSSDGKSSDAYVKVLLCPKDLFPEVKKLKTKCQKKTLFPMFDEKFVVPLTLKQKSKESIIHFKVNNKDSFGRNNGNRYIGECFLSFASVDDLTHETRKAKQTQLMLNRPTNLDYDCITTLEDRQGADKEAKEFLKDLKSKLQQ